MGPSRSCWNGRKSALHRRRLLGRGLEFHVCTINKSAHTKKVWKLIVSTSYGNDARMLHAILSKSWKQHPKRHLLYGYLPFISQTIQERRTRHAGYCCSSKDELISDILSWTTTHGHIRVGRSEMIFLDQLCAGTVGSLEELPGAIDVRDT